MKFLFSQCISGWKMSGILGKGARWFLGFSKLPIDKEEPTETWVSSAEHYKLLAQLDSIILELDKLKANLNTSPNYVVGQQYIVCAAARNNDTGQIICSPRHYDKIFHQSNVARSTAWNVADQGFVDQYGNFLTRAEAHKIAVAAGQIRRRCGGDHEELYSENLY